MIRPTRNGLASAFSVEHWVTLALEPALWVVVRDQLAMGRSPEQIGDQMTLEQGDQSRGHLSLY
jgi:hypothetical protein